MVDSFPPLLGACRRGRWLGRGTRLSLNDGCGGAAEAASCLSCRSVTTALL